MTDLTLPTEAGLEEMRLKALADFRERLKESQEVAKEATQRGKKGRARLPRTKTPDRADRPPLVAISGHKRIYGNSHQNQKKREKAR